MSEDIASISVVEIPDTVDIGCRHHEILKRRADAWLMARMEGHNLRLAPSQLTVREMTDGEREARRMRLQKAIGAPVKRDAVYSVRRPRSKADEPNPATPPNPEPKPDRVAIVKATTPCRRREKSAKHSSTWSTGFAMKNLSLIIAKWLGIA